MVVSTGDLMPVRVVAAKEDRWEHPFNAVSTPTIGVMDSMIDESVNDLIDTLMAN